MKKRKNDYNHNDVVETPLDLLSFFVPNQSSTDDLQGQQRRRRRILDKETREGLLDTILDYVGDDPNDMARLLKVNRSVRAVVATKIDKAIVVLVGRHIKPTLGQTPCELFRAAKSSAVALERNGYFHGNPTKISYEKVSGSVFPTSQTQKSALVREK